MYLGMDTSTKSGSVALVEGARVVAEIESDGGMLFSRSLLEMIEKLLAKNGLRLDHVSALSVTLGPGSFTGTRIGLATAYGMAIARKIPVYGVSSLESMSRAVKQNGKSLMPLLDAGRDNVYFAKFHYSGGDLVRDMEDAVAPVEEALKQATKDTLFFGDGATFYEEKIRAFGNVCGRNILNHSIAAGAALLAVAADPRNAFQVWKNGNEAVLKPDYIRRSPAENQQHEPLRRKNL